MTGKLCLKKVYSVMQGVKIRQLPAQELDATVWICAVFFFVTTNNIKLVRKSRNEVAYCQNRFSVLFVSFEVFGLDNIKVMVSWSIFCGRTEDRTSKLLNSSRCYEMD